MIDRLRGALSPLLGWGLLFVLGLSSVSAQSLYRFITGNTRALLIPGATASMDRDGVADHPIQLLQLTRPALHSMVAYDDVYRQGGDSTRHYLNHLVTVNRLELPWGAGRKGGLAVELGYLSTDLYTSPAPGQAYAFNQRLARLNLGLAGPAWGSRLSLGASLGASRLSSTWVPGYALEAAIRLHSRLLLLLSVGHRSEVKDFDLQDEDENIAMEVKTHHDRWGASVTVGLGSRFELRGAYHRRHVYARAGWYETDGYRLNPQLNAQEWKFAFAARTGGQWSLDFSLLHFRQQGHARLTFDQQQFGRFTRLNPSETDVELTATYTLTPTKLVSLGYSRLIMTSEQSGHLDGWPFSGSVFGSAARRYFRSWPEVHMERVSLTWARVQPSGADLELHLDYLWLRPQSDLWIRETTLVLFGKTTWYRLNLQEAQILVPQVRKSVRLGPLLLSYAFAQAVPTKIRRREPPTPGVGGKGQAKGGGYHLVKLVIFW